MSSIPFNCQKLLEQTIGNVTSTQDIEEKIDKLRQVADYTQKIVEGIANEWKGILITMAGEAVGPVVLKLMKKKLTGQIGKLLISSAKLFGSAYNMFTLAEMTVSLSRSLAGVPLNVRIDREVIDEAWEEFFNSYDDIINKNESINCIKNHMKEYLKQRGIEYSQENINTTLKELTSIHKPESEINIATKIFNKDCTPCMQLTKDISKNIVPESCKLSVYGSPDISGYLLLGQPTDKCPESYREGYLDYINSPYDYPYPGIQLYEVDWNTVRRSKNPEECEPGKYINCLIGDSEKCYNCILADKLETSEPTPFLVSSPSPSSTHNKNNIFLITLITILIISILLLLYFLLLKKNVQSI